jgi:thiamine-phosphate pyrophosphorylase
LGIKLPALYPILDTALLARRGISLEAAAGALWAAGIRFLQLRDKEAEDADFLDQARRLRAVFPAGESLLLLNDRAELCAAAECDGVHLGQEDMDIPAARAVVGGGRILGLSTHNADQLRAAEQSVADYVAIGPVFATGSKRNPDPVVGLAGVREARRLTGKPLVAIGGITRAKARDVLAAGADAVAVISGLLPPEDRNGNAAEMTEIAGDFLASLR